MKMFRIIRRYYHDFNEYLSKIRNIALLAHIDAGKTTTTERMLYYTGRITHMGNVDDGNTVTDFMDLERLRGITIASAFVTLPWKQYTMNLVDTPGHIDFTMQVEQALKVIDSAVIILDATAGVQAQTMTVYRQLMRNNLPSLFYVNKMDRPNANYDLCLSNIKEKLLITPLPIHLPVGDQKHLGHINIINMEELLWDLNSENFTRKPLIESDKYYIEALQARINLIDTLTEFDEQLAEIVLENNCLETVDNQEIESAIRRVTNAKKGCPVICGSSYKNIGIESLLDSVTNYLPSPLECVDNILFSDLESNELIAKCFKILHDRQRGPISLFRIYSGHISKGQKVYNVFQNRTDQIGRLLKVFANELQEVPDARCGHFVATTGLKDLVCGDLICSSASTFSRLKNKLSKKSEIASESVKQLFQDDNVVPEPVFFCSIEPESQKWQTDLEKALKELQKEDPSIRVDCDEETGQTILAGMGELHLEIVKEKLIRNYNLKVDTGPIQIAYKEQLISSPSAKDTFILKNKIVGEAHTVTITLSLETAVGQQLLSLDTSKQSSDNLSTITMKQLAAIKSGLKIALKHGPLYSSQVVNIHAVLHWFECKKSTPDTLIVAAAAQCVSKILKSCGTQLMEPYMNVNITVNNEYLKTILADLTKRRAQNLDIIYHENFKEINCEVPLAELLGYAKHLRCISSGAANFTMQYSTHRLMSSQQMQLSKIC